MSCVAYLQSSASRTITEQVAAPRSPSDSEAYMELLTSLALDVTVQVSHQSINILPCCLILVADGRSHCLERLLGPMRSLHQTES